MTSAGLLAMQVRGKYESPLVTGAADWQLEPGNAPTQRKARPNVSQTGSGVVA